MGNNGRVIRSWLARVYRSRPVRTFAQTLAALISAAVASGQGVDAVDWRNVISVSLLAAAYSALLIAAEGGTSGPVTGAGEVPSRDEH